ncbi:MAG TPA: heme-binding domain-containing protein [Bacteroidales bacterium]|nr:heme-binding domain-containing protein [Bacteroidales bacterium]
MKLAKKILTVIVIVFVAIQFFRPDRNIARQASSSDISGVFSMPDSVKVILQNACYDCHSDNTRYPWYVNIQPAGWWMAGHISDAKGDLNFSEFGGYEQRRQISKLEGVAAVIEEDIMPLRSYKMMHKSARLSSDEKNLLINWAQKSADSITAK